jgi:RNA polymerase sigma-70 factor (ECF subfamily)
MVNYAVCTDEELMLHLTRGEALAFDVLYGRYSRKLLGYFVRMLNYDRERAEDALQDLFLKVVEHPESFDPARTFRPWIYALAYNTCKNYYKHNTLKKEAHQELMISGQDPDEEPFLKAARKLDSASFRKALEALLEELPIEKKEVFVLRYQENHSLLEIASITGCSEGTVKSRIHYTLRTLEEKLNVFNPIKD